MHAKRNLLFSVGLGFCLMSLQEAKAQNVPTSLSPGKQKEAPLMLQTTKTRKKHKSSFFSPRRKNVKHTPEYEFYERIEQRAKEKQRILKILSKRQYSDPRYFGHKRIPKRRPANKMRYCGECGIRH